jgi:AbrB family looped-hinge helix DNA binding protein
MSEYRTTMTRKGQVTIPVEIRRALGLKEGDQVAVNQNGDGIVMRRAESVVERTAGILAHYGRKPAPTIDEMEEAAAQAIADGAMQGMER